MKQIFMFILTILTFGSFSVYSQSGTPAKVKVGVILSGNGSQDGSDIYEAAFTILALEKANAEIIMMAPNIPQTNVINHLTKAKSEEKRNTLVESARIARGKIKDIKDVKSADLDAIIVVGGLGSVLTLSDVSAKGAECTINDDVKRLIVELHKAKKPIGSMCLASMMIAKILGAEKVKITIGKNNEKFGPAITAMGAEHIPATSKDMVYDDKNKVVTTPALMGGTSNVDISIGIEKTVNKVLQLVK
jgi:enhancing lycopene biosynthesis protein 2